MCNRYALSKKQERLITREFGSLEFYFTQRFNIAPTQSVPVALVEDGKLVCWEMKWGFVPKWTKAPVTNAQFETLDKKPLFRNAFETRRCLIPASGFYEWQRFGQRKQPILFVLPDERLFFFAGLYSTASPGGSFVIITTAANQFVREVHNRMPLILAPNDYDRWLDPKSDSFKTVTPTTEALKTYWVSDRLNSSRIDDEEYARPLPATVKSVDRVYPLPDGLPERATVKVRAFDHGFYEVEFEGKVFRVFIGGVSFNGDTGNLL